MTTLFVVLIAMTAGQLVAGFSYQVDFTSRYIWRGFDLNPNKKPAIQPSVTYAFGDSGFAVTAWGSISFEDKAATELDFILNYDFKTNGDYTLSAGIANYGWYFGGDFDWENNTSQEAYVTLGFPKFFLSPKVTAYYDFGNGDGFYFLLETGHTLELSEKLKADLYANLGYNAGQWLPDWVDTGFSDLVIGASVPLKMGKVTVSPFVNYSFALLDLPFFEDHFWFGFSLIF